MVLVDRNREFANLEELLIDCQHSRARVAVISGEAGSGKTALLHAFAEGAAQSGTLWLNSTASPSEQSIPLAVLDQIFRRPDLDPEMADRAIQLLDHIPFEPALKDTNSEEISTSMTSALREFWNLLHDLTRNRPVIVSVDDIHYADDHSLKFLLYLLCRLRSAPLLMILTERVHAPQLDSVLPPDLPEQPCAHVLRLNPLSLDGVEKLLDDNLDSQVARKLAKAIHQVSSGCPTLVHALIEDSRTRGEGSDRPPPMGEAFSQAVVRCVERSGRLTKKLARAIAVLGESVSPALLGKMLGLDTAFASQALAAFTAKGTVDESGFRQPAVRTAVIDSIPPQERMTLHRKAAELLHDEGAQPSTVAHHIIAAGNVADRWMITALQEAAEDALTSDSTDLAVRYLQLAQQTCAGMVCDTADRAALTSLLARAEWRCDPATVLRHLPLLESAARDGKLEGRHAIMLLTQLLWHGRTEAAMDVLNSIVRTYYGTMTFESAKRTAVDPPLLWLFYLYPDFLRKIADHDQYTSSSSFESTAVTSQLQEAATLSKALADRNDKEVLDIAERILQNAHLSDRSVPPLSAALLSLVCIDRLDIATKWCDAILEEAAARNTTTWHAVFAAVRSIMSFRQGDLASTQEHASKALDLIPAKSWGVAIGIPLASMLAACVSKGDHAQADILLKTPVPEQMFLTPIGLFYLHARGHYHLAAQRIRAALSDFQMCGKLMDRWNMDLPTFIPWRTDAALAYLELGEGGSAKRLAEEQLKLVPTGHHRARGLTLRVQAAVSSLRARPRVLQEALTALQLCDDRLETARVLADTSRVHHTVNNRSTARKLARRAHLLAEQCGAEPLAHLIFPNGLTSDETTTELTVSGRIRELSDAERRVASLAAVGHTNLEISQKLYITISTVEQHLTRIYRKLAVDRSDLSTILPADASVDASAAS